LDGNQTAHLGFQLFLAEATYGSYIMAYTHDQLSEIYDKTNGYCACCSKKLSFSNYGLQGGPYAKGRWEVAHRRARARGGSNRISNLWPMCLECNRGMGIVDANRYCGM
jgi:hypothetical protein